MHGLLKERTGPLRLDTTVLEKDMLDAEIYVEWVSLCAPYVRLKTVTSLKQASSRKNELLDVQLWAHSTNSSPSRQLGASVDHL